MELLADSIKIDISNKQEIAAILSSQDEFGYLSMVDYHCDDCYTIRLFHYFDHSGLYEACTEEYLKFYNEVLQKL